ASTGDRRIRGRRPRPAPAPAGARPRDQAPGPCSGPPRPPATSLPWNRGAPAGKSRPAPAPAARRTLRCSRPPRSRAGAEAKAPARTARDRPLPKAARRPLRPAAAAAGAPTPPARYDDSALPVSTLPLLNPGGFQIVRSAAKYSVARRRFLPGRKIISPDPILAIGRKPSLTPRP